MKKGFLILFLLSTTIVFGQSKEQQEVTDAVQRLNKALVAADSTALVQLTDNALNYGHSTGKIEDKATFVHNAVSGSLKFQSITATDLWVNVYKRMAVVRHTFTAKATNNGTPTDLNLSVLQVWQKQKGKWILLARQAVKL
jgi:ketosteroid isomerase-like protein